MGCQKKNWQKKIKILGSQRAKQKLEPILCILI